MATTAAPSSDYRQVLTDALIESLEKGTAPWQKPWDARSGSANRLPYNPTTGAVYRGANSLWLSMVAGAKGYDDPRWATYRQAEEQGWQVQKGQKGSLVEYWKFREDQQERDPDTGRPLVNEDGTPKMISVQLERPKVFRAVVFNAKQMDGVPELARTAREYEWDPETRAEQIMSSSGAKVFHDQNDRAFYSPAADEIHMPGKDQFPDSGRYYGTALHELGHWTGHESRLGRNIGNAFGSPEYAREELRAELTSYFMSDKLGIPHDPERHASYVKSWIKTLKDDKNEIFRASADAEKITEYILQLDRDRSVEVAREPEIDRGGFELASLPGHTAHYNDSPGMAGVEIHTPDAQIVQFGGRAALEQYGQEMNLSAQDMGALRGLDAQADRFRREDDRYNAKRVDLNVPFRDKNLAKEAGAKWDKDGKTWYAPAGVDMSKLEKWRTLRPEMPAAPPLGVQPGDVDALSAARLRAAPAPERAAVAPTTEKTFIHVPYTERYAAKEAGAKWDKDAKSWYAPPGADLDKFAKWQAGPQAEREPGPDPEVRALRDKEMSVRLDPNATDAQKEAAKEARKEAEYHSMPSVQQERAERSLQAPGALQTPAPQAPAREVAPAAPAQRNHSGGERTYLAVPFTEKDEARAAGAKWDKEAKSWYAPAGAQAADVDKWKPRQSPALGESRGDPETEFGNAIRAAGLVLEGPPVMNGKMQRVPVEGGSKGNRSGAYVGYLDGKPAGMIQNWTTGEKQNWKHDGPEMSPEERANLAAQALIKKQARAAELAATHDEAAGKAQYRWNNAQPMGPEESTPYLDRKQVPAVGLRRDGENLLVPVRDNAGKVWAVQTIFPEKRALETEPGSPGQPGAEIDKVFTKNGKKEGNYHLLGEVKPGQPILTMEGYATAASAHLATGHAVAVAFDSGNLDAVVGALKEKYPTNPHFIGADDDRFPKPGRPDVNAGLTKALQAANNHSVGVIIPEFTKEGKLTDFNDLHVSEGLDAVRSQIARGVDLSMQQSREHAEGIAKARQGGGVALQQPGASTRHTGEVLGVTDYHATQSTGRNSAVVHAVGDLDAKPVPGRVQTVQYQDGRGQVKDKAPEVTKEKQLAR